MSADRARLLREWFEAACDLPEGEWAGFLQGCEDVPLRAEVLDLLQRDRAPGQPLDDPLLPPSQREALLALAGDAPMPARIGPYEVVRVIGRGSMGTVYEARAPGDGTLVAIKVLRMGLPTRAMLHRFRREAEILERLEHPCIARILQSGTTQVGLATLPFIAMELVAGRPLDQYCKEERLKLRARLELLAQVGEAVQHAHERGVVHRDLKPSNILVDAQGRPRLLDFGVARATAGSAGAGPGGPGSLHTATGQLVGTLQYMSPEQTLGDPSAVDARADVYALGAIAYRLLAGRPPYEVSGCSFDEALRRVRHDPPPPLDRLSRPLRRQVEVVVGRALEKERSDRYPSAQAFVDDLRALRDGRPSAARAPSLRQQLRRMARRDPRAFRAAMIVAGVLLLGIAGTSWGWLVASARQRDVVSALDVQRAATAAADAARAEAEQARAEAEDARAAAERSEAAMHTAWSGSEAVVTFLEGMFDAVHPENLGSRVTLVDALLLAATRVDDDMAGQPLLAARVHRTLALGFYAVGRYERVLEHLDAADQLDPDPVAQLVTRKVRGQVLMAQGRYAEAVPLLEDLSARVPADNIMLRVAVARELAWALTATGDRAAGVEKLTCLLGADGHVAGLPVDLDELVRLDFARIAMERGDVAQAEATMRAVLQERTERLGPDHIQTAEAADRLAQLLEGTGRLAEAEALYGPCVEVLTRQLGPEHLLTLWARHERAQLQAKSGLGAEVLPELDDLLAICRRVLGNGHPQTATVLYTISVVAHDAGRPDGLALEEEAVAVTRALYGDDQPALVGLLTNLGKGYMQAGRMEEGIATTREALALCERNGGADGINQFKAQGNLAIGLIQMGRDAEARPLVEAALARSRALNGETHTKTLELRHALAEICRVLGELEQARAMHEETMRIAADAGQTYFVIASRASLGQTRVEQGERAEGVALVRASLAEAEQIGGPDNEIAAWCRQYLVEIEAPPASSP